MNSSLDLLSGFKILSLNPYNDKSYLVYELFIALGD